MHRESLSCAAPTTLRRIPRRAQPGFELGRTAVQQGLVKGVTVLGNLAIDVIDGAPPSPGGCASFAGVA